MREKLAALALTLTLLTQSGLLAVPAAAFSDVDEGLYYAAPIAWAVEKGIAAGTGGTAFSPDAICTHGQILTFLWRAAGSPEPESMESPYDGVTPGMNPDFYRAILWAGETGLIRPGGPGAVSPDAPCTRASAVSFLWRSAGAPAAGSPAAFTDVAPEADYAQAVAWAVEAGITAGTGEATFSPDAICTRGQIVTFLYRFMSGAGGKAGLSGSPAQQPDESVPPQRVLTGQGTACSLGLDGSEFTAGGVYEAKATVEIYSAHEAVFTVKVPFPLYQACNYTVRFDDPQQSGMDYLATFLRWDEAFADMIPWEGDQNSFRFTDSSGSSSGYQAVGSLLEEHRADGELSWRVSFPEDGGFDLDRLEGYLVSCVVGSSL